jgi:hypothetical protein
MGPAPLERDAVTAGSSKSEIRNPKQIRMFEIQNSKREHRPGPRFGHWHFGFWICFGFGVWCLGFLPPGSLASDASGQNSDTRPTVIVVVGAPGTPEYATQFSAWAKLWEQVCAKSKATFTGVGLEESGTSSDCERIHELLAGQSQETAAALWLVLIGHGTFDGRTAKFNLRGPDLSARDLAEWLKPPGRIVITATKSGFEQNYARFGQYFAEAIIDPKADLDKDGQTSLLEAFLSASHATGQFYAAAGRLATEHALLDDNGDGLGTPAEWFRGIRPVQRARDGASLDGYRAHQLHLLPSPGEAALPPDVRATRDQLELQVMELRDIRAKLSDDEYFSKLEPLLRAIAQIYEQRDESNATNKSAPQ